MQKIVQRMRKATGMPAEFTLDACRHGGMTELEEAELTDGPGPRVVCTSHPRKLRGLRKADGAAHSVGNQEASHPHHGEQGFSGSAG